MGHRLSGSTPPAATRLAISTHVQPPAVPPDFIPVDPVIAAAIGLPDDGVGRAVGWIADRARHAWRIPGDAPWDIDWAWAAGALQLIGDVVLDPEGRVLVGPEVDPGAQIPAPVDARSRRAASLVSLANRGIDPPECPPIAGAAELIRPIPDDVAARMLALFLVAVRGESVASGHAIDPALMLDRSRIGAVALSPDERGLFDRTPTAEQAQAAGWAYESIATMLWATGRSDTLRWPDQTIDVVEVIEPMTAADDAQFAAATRIRPIADLLDQLDSHYLLWRTIIDADPAADPLAGGVDPGVVAHRLIALTWLVSFREPECDRLPVRWHQVRDAVLGDLAGGRTVAWLL